MTLSYIAIDTGDFRNHILECLEQEWPLCCEEWKHFSAVQFSMNWSSNIVLKHFVGRKSKYMCIYLKLIHQGERKEGERNVIFLLRLIKLVKDSSYCPGFIQYSTWIFYSPRLQCLASQHDNKDHQIQWDIKGIKLCYQTIFEKKQITLNQ